MSPRAFLSPAAGVGALALLAALMWLATRPDCCNASAVAQAPVPAPASIPADAVGESQRAAGEGPVARLAAPARAAGLRELLRRPVGELRQSVLRAQARHDEGGRLYSRYLLRQCAAADAVAGLHAPEGDDPGSVAAPDAGDPRVQRALAQVQMLRAACAQLTPQELAAGTNILATDLAHDDPLLAIVDRFGAASADARDAQLHQVLTQPDPLLLQELAPRLAARTSDDQGYYFDGARYRAEDVQAALALLPCAFGLPCDASDPMVWTACLEGRACVDDRIELVLRQSAPDDPVRQRRILALSRRMVEAVRNAEVDRFMPPA